MYAKDFHDSKHYVDKEEKMMPITSQRAIGLTHGAYKTVQIVNFPTKDFGSEVTIDNVPRCNLVDLFVQMDVPASASGTSRPYLAMQLISTVEIRIDDIYHETYSYPDVMSDIISRLPASKVHSLLYNAGGIGGIATAHKISAFIPTPWSNFINKDSKPFPAQNLKKIQISLTLRPIADCYNGTFTPTALTKLSLIIHSVKTTQPTPDKIVYNGFRYISQKSAALTTATNYDITSTVSRGVAKSLSVFIKSVATYDTAENRLTIASADLDSFALDVDGTKVYNFKNNSEINSVSVANGANNVIFHSAGPVLNLIGLGLYLDFSLGDYGNNHIGGFAMNNSESVKFDVNHSVGSNSYAIFVWRKYNHFVIEKGQGLVKYWD